MKFNVFKFFIYLRILDFIIHIPYSFFSVLSCSYTLLPTYSISADQWELNMKRSRLTLEKMKQVHQIRECINKVYGMYIKCSEITYHGNGQAIVSKSIMAIASKTIFVGVLMFFWLSTMMTSELQIMVTIKFTGTMYP